jgi:hypothetical protein
MCEGTKNEWRLWVAWRLMRPVLLTKLMVYLS